MKKITVVLLVIAGLSLFGCVQIGNIAKTPYQRAYQRETKRLRHYEWKKVVRKIAIYDARKGNCYLHPYAEVPLQWVSYYFDACEQEQKWIFQREIWRDRWRQNKERLRGKRDAWRDFYSR